MEEDDEFLETGWDPDPEPPEVLVTWLDCVAPVGLLGMVPVLAAIALVPAEIGGELAFIIID